LLGLRQIFPDRYAGYLSAFLPIKLNRLTAMNTERKKLFRLGSTASGWAAVNTLCITRLAGIVNLHTENNKYETTY